MVRRYRELQHMMLYVYTQQPSLPPFPFAVLLSLRGSVHDNHPG